jgi:hypothetical protein
VDLPTPSARRLGPADRAALRAFRCSTGRWFEDEVETHVQNDLLDAHAARRSHTDHCAIALELPDHGIVAVTAHEQDLTTEGGRDLTSTRWLVAAVAVDLQGAKLPDVDLGDGRPVTLGRYLAEATLSDVLETDRDPVVRAVIARENDRSLALCRRVGLTRELPDADGRYLSLLGTY